jgi:hypothetical protein
MRSRRVRLEVRDRFFADGFPGFRIIARVFGFDARPVSYWLTCG